MFWCFASSSRVWLCDGVHGWMCVRFLYSISFFFKVWFCDINFVQTLWKDHEVNIITEILKKFHRVLSLKCLPTSYMERGAVYLSSTARCLPIYAHIFDAFSEHMMFNVHGNDGNLLRLGHTTLPKKHLLLNSMLMVPSHSPFTNAGCWWFAMRCVSAKWCSRNNANERYICLYMRVMLDHIIGRWYHVTYIYDGHMLKICLCFIRKGYIYIVQQWFVRFVWLV